MSKSAVHNSPPTDKEHVQIEVYDAYRPALTAGRHRIVMQQTVQFTDKDSKPQQRHYYRDNPFTVCGPRFFLDENDIQAKYPPAGAVGDFDRHVPNIVLRKRALPWERKLELGTDAPAPWMALFVLTEAEYEGLGGDAAIRVVKPADLVLKSRKSSDGAALLPRLEPEGDENDEKSRASVIDIGRDLAQALCPSAQDLALLAHVRNVSMGDKPRADMHGAGEFPVVAAARIASPGTNVALLLSLEGWEELIPGSGAGPLPAGKEPLRMVVLSRWRFTHDPARVHSFAGIARALKTGMLRSPLPDDAPAQIQAPLAAGYTPMTWRLLDGSSSLAWYRGPLSPVPPQPLPIDEFHHADAALLVSPEDGTMTLSYAVAWQLGRLLALSSPAFLQATRAFVKDDAGPREVAFRLETFMRNHFEAIKREWVVPRAVVAGPVNGKAEVPGYFHAGLTMLGWLEGLMRLERIPFHHLVPSETLLPTGGMRFFHIDGDWIVALVNGALSLSGTATREATAAAPGMRKLLSLLMERCQARDQAELDPKGTYLDRGMTGFLLRSTLVSGWPGLETIVETASPSVRPLRLERLAPDILFCLVPDRLTKVTFKEPPEGLVFGLKAARAGVPEPDRRGIFSPSSRLTAERGSGAAKPTAPDFARSAMTSGSIQTITWEDAQ